MGAAFYTMLAEVLIEAPLHPDRETEAPIPSQRPPLVREPLLQPLSMEFQVSVEELRLLSTEDRFDLIGWHSLAPKRVGCPHA